VLVAATCLLALGFVAYALNVQDQVQGFVRGEKFFEGRPKRYWSAQLGSSDKGLRDVAMARLRAGGQAALPVLGEIVADQRSAGRREAIKVLGQMRATPAVALLIPLLEDGEPETRRATAEALGDSGSAAKEAVPALVAALSLPTDKKNSGRSSYAAALEHFGGAPDQDIFYQFRDRRVGAPEIPWYSLDFSADGKQFMAHRGNDVLVWDRSMRNDYVFFTIRDGVRRAAIHPNGKEAVVADVVGGLTQYRLANGETVSRLERLPDKLPITSSSWSRRLVYSPDGRILAVIGDDKLEVHDVTQSPFKRLTHFEGLPNTRIDSVFFSADGQTIALHDNTEMEAPKISVGTWWLFDMKTGKLRQRFPGGQAGRECEALSTDGGLFAVKSSGAVSVWDTITGKKTVVSGHSEGAIITSLVFVSPDRLAIGTDKGDLALWNARTGKKLRDLPWHCREVQALAVSPDGKTLASADGGYWDGAGDPGGWVKLWALGPESDRE
jgi:HEAT repeats